MLTFAALSLVLSWFACPPDPAAPALVAKLGDRSWRTRQGADVALQVMGRKAAGAIQDALDGSDDPEIISRCRRLLERLWDAGSVWDGLVPWVDGLDCRTVWAPYLSRAQAGQAWEPLGWPSWRTATGALVTDLLRVGTPAWWLRAMLEGMALREAEYRRQHPLLQWTP